MENGSACTISNGSTWGLLSTQEARVTWGDSLLFFALQPPAQNYNSKYDFLNIMIWYVIWFMMWYFVIYDMIDI